MARSTLWKHRKFRRLEMALKSKALAAGVLECMWSCGYESGDALIGTSDEVERACGWSGKRGQLTPILLEIGWIDDGPDGYVIHDLYDHAPDYVKRRKNREDQRRSQRTGSDRSADGQRTGSDSNSPLPYPNPTQPNPEKPPYPPESAAQQGSDLEQPGPEGQAIEPDVWSGEVIAVDRLLDARLRRLYPQRYISEQLPLADAKLATARLPNESLSRQRTGAFVLSWLDRGWSEVKAKGRESSYADPKPYRPRTETDPAPEMTDEEIAEGKRVAAEIRRSLETAARRERQPEEVVA